MMYHEKVMNFLEVLEERYSLKIEQIQREVDKKRPDYHKINEFKAAEFELLQLRKAYSDYLEKS